LAGHIYSTTDSCHLILELLEVERMFDDLTPVSLDFVFEAVVVTLLLCHRCRYLYHTHTRTHARTHARTHTHTHTHTRTHTLSRHINWRNPVHSVFNKKWATARGGLALRTGPG